VATPAHRDKTKRDALVAENRRARFDYDIGDTLECGIELKGVEVKSLRAKAVVFKDAYAIIKDGELLLVGLQIDRFRAASTHEVLDSDRTRRLLASAAEIEDLRRDVQQKGLSLIPLKIYFKGAWAKVLIGVGRGKTHDDKRETVRRREADRDMQRAMRRR
jgi:SsrA-binding protein